MKIKNLGYSYDGKTEVLKQINMDFNKGHKIGIIGVNGSGKSTLFLNMVGVLRPTTGEVSYKGKRLSYHKKDLYELRKKVNMVFQDPEQQIFYDEVYEDMAFALRNLGLNEIEVKNKIEAALKKVGGLEWAHKGAHFLSYGQKKRVAIASILTLDLEVVLLDEPTAGLDPASRLQMINLIEEMENLGIKVILSSHDMDLIYEVCDYIYVMSEGKLIKEGTVREVFTEGMALSEIGLTDPWLVKVHKHMGVPLFKKEEALFTYYKKEKR